MIHDEDGKFSMLSSVEPGYTGIGYPEIGYTEIGYIEIDYTEIDYTEISYTGKPCYNSKLNKIFEILI